MMKNFGSYSPSTAPPYKLTGHSYQQVDRSQSPEPLQLSDRLFPIRSTNCPIGKLNILGRHSFNTQRQSTEQAGRQQIDVTLLAKFRISAAREHMD
jgi:hypothetical protein